MSVPEAAIAAALESFKGVEHRLEEVAEVDGVLYVNDSKATNVAAAAVALESFDGGVHAILGGSVKGERFGGLREPLGRAASAAYLIGDAAPAMEEDLAGLDVPLTVSGTLEEALAAARAAAGPGDTVLLAPACASFDQFQDYEARGRRFKELVRELSAAGAGQA